jgi:Flp pilus assembly protein TadD
VIITGLGGVVDACENGWDSSVHERLKSRFFGTLADTVGTSAPFPSSQHRGDSAARKSPTACEMQSVMARAFWRYGRRDSAIVLMGGLADTCPGFNSQDRARLASWLWSRGNSRGAVAATNAAIRSDSNSGWVWTAHAAIASRLGKTVEATASASRAIALDSNFFPPWGIMAASALASGDTAGCRADLRRARMLNRHDADLSAVAAVFAELTGDKAKAARLWRAAVEERLGRR